MTCLTTLKVSINKFKEIPEEIGRLKALELLDAHGSTLVCLPRSICHLVSLKCLLLKENGLVSIPEEIGELASLELMDLSRNELRALPPTMGKLQKLTKLFLADNNLVTLPCELSKLKSHLTTLTVARNPLQVPPLEVCKEGFREVLRYLSGIKSQSGNVYHRRGVSPSADVIFEIAIPQWSTLVSEGENRHLES